VDSAKEFMTVRKINISMSSTIAEVGAEGIHKNAIEIGSIPARPTNSVI